MDIIEQLRRDEGEVLHAYQDSNGFWTIGSGILIDSRRGGGITQAENSFLIANRVHLVDKSLSEALPWFDSSNPRHQVLLNLGYNVGVHGTMGFQNFLSYLHDSNWDIAAQELLDSKWALQVGDRAIRLARQVRTGEWQ